MIDLHLHTTVSDGRCSPTELVDRAAAAGLTIMAVTDHDTTAGIAQVRAAARVHGIEAVAGIEITAVEDGRDVHVLGYLFDPEDGPLNAFLAEQRAARIARVDAIGSRLSALGVPIDTRPLVAHAQREAGRAVGRPQIARALVEAGHVADTQEAFDRWLAYGRPAFVPRAGVAPSVAVEVIHRAGGIASLAHPGKTGIDGSIAALKDEGLDAIEVFHPDHDAALVDRYSRLARDLGLLVTGGSDFHGDPTHGTSPGSVTLPTDEWRRLQEAWTSHGSGETAVSLRGVLKDYRGLRPLRIERLELRMGESVALLGLDRAAAESLVNLITGATLPDAGDVEVFGASTRSIADADAWLRALDRFGILSERAVLLDQLTVEQNLALPLSLELDDLTPELRAQTQQLATEVGIGPEELPRAVAAVAAPVQMRVRLGKALAQGPQVVLAEHPNALLQSDDRTAFAAAFADVTARRGVASLVLTADEKFARTIARQVLSLDAATGAISAHGALWGWLPWRGR